MASLDELNIVAVLGQGAFGKVFLAKPESGYLAVKMLKKSKMLKDNMVAQVEFEIKVMTDFK